MGACYLSRADKYAAAVQRGGLVSHCGQLLHQTNVVGGL